MKTIKFAHFSDTHYVCDNASDFIKKIYANYNTKENFIRELKKLPPVDFVLLTGDIVHDGNAGDYRAFKELLLDYLPEVPVFTSLGNHDFRPHFYQGFLGIDKGNEPYLSVDHFEDLRIVTLDSAYDYGMEGLISPSQVEWLASALKEPYGRGTFILTHHPFLAPLQKAATKYAPGFVEVIENSDVIGFFNGHIHQNNYSHFLNIPHITSESMCFGITMEKEWSIYTNRTGYSICTLEDKNIGVAVKTQGQYFTELQRKSNILA